LCCTIASAASFTLIYHQLIEVSLLSLARVLATVRVKLADRPALHVELCPQAVFASKLGLWPHASFAKKPGSFESLILPFVFGLSLRNSIAWTARVLSSSWRRRHCVQTYNEASS
jgi:hypothetical protein